MNWNEIEVLYASGKIAAEIKFGAETRDYDRVLGGVGHVLAAGGIQKSDIMSVSQRWHYPLASFSNRETAKQVFESMLAAKRVSPEKSRALDEINRISDYMLYSASDKATITRKHFTEKVNDLIDSEIKRAFPGTKRNTKRYKELHAQVQQKASLYILNDLVDQKNKVVAELRNHYNNYLVPKMDKYLGDIEAYREYAADLAVVFPNSVEVKGLLDTANAIQDAVANKLAYYENSINEMEKTNLILDLTSPTPEGWGFSGNDEYSHR